MMASLKGSIHYVLISVVLVIINKKYLGTTIQIAACSSSADVEISPHEFSS